VVRTIKPAVVASKKGKGSYNRKKETKCLNS
jgi:stalled ribosome alternative rescue factor ArfA